MELRHLKYFVTVAETLSFSEAAKKLYRAQPAISQQIADLERDLELDLFIRTKRSVKLTDSGKIFYNKAKDILAQVEDLIDETKRASLGQQGTLSIGFMAPSASHFLPRAVQKFKKEYPTVKVVMSEMFPNVQLEALHEGKINVAFARPFDKKQYPHFDSLLLYRDDVVVMLPEEHPLAKLKRSLKISDIIDEQLITLRRDIAPGYFAMLNQIYGDDVHKIKIGYETMEIQSIITMIESGCGIGIGPGCVATMKHHKLAFKKIESVDFFADLLMVWRANEHNALVDNFIKEIKLLKSKNFCDLK